jgi:hypothetical protein
MRGRKPKSCAGSSRLVKGRPGRNDNKPQGRKRNTPTQCKTMVCIKFLLYTREVTQVQIKFHFVQTKSSEQSKNWACQRILSTSQIDSVHSSSIIVNGLCLHRQVMEQTHIWCQGYAAYRRQLPDRGKFNIARAGRSHQHCTYIAIELHSDSSIQQP